METGGAVSPDVGDHRGLETPDTSEHFSPLGIKGLLFVTSNYTYLVLDLSSNEKI